jgi:ATP-dependent Clp protease ATP-binding subunit ClpA
MTALPPRFIEDRALRDAARAVLDEDIARLRASLDEQGVGSRVSSSLRETVGGRIRTGASDVFEQAKQSATDNRGILAILIGAILLWLMRGPLLALLEGAAEDADAALEAEAETSDATTGDTAAVPQPADGE